MRRTARFLFPLLALLPQPLAAQVLPYDLDFGEGDGGSERMIEAVRLRAPLDPQAPGADFAVHAGEDGAGREPGDYAADVRQHQAYLDYYRAVGMSDGQALSFYAMTISVPLADARWLSAGEMDRWAGFDAPAAPPRPDRANTARRSAAYGPFRILDETRAAMVGVTDAGTPAAFDAMLRDHPGIARIEMVDCPGTEDDRANLRLGRMIRDRGIAMHVPADGWVASGAVDLYLAGTERSAEPSARFAVHSWEDDSGRGPNDYSPNAPKNRAYIDYYRAMGMSDGEARAFYAMTNSAPFSNPRSLTAADIAPWAEMGRTVMRTPVALRGQLARVLPTPVGAAAVPMGY